MNLNLFYSDKSNQKVRDTILLKKLKAILREETQESENLWNDLNFIIKDFKTPSIKQQVNNFIVFLVHNKF